MMSFVTFANLWSVSYFLLFFYVVLVSAAILYAVPAVPESLRRADLKTRSNATILFGLDLRRLVGFLLCPLFIVNSAWAAPVVVVWFGNLVFAAFQQKLGFLILAMFLAAASVLFSSFFFATREVYDYAIVSLNFFIWMYFLFSARTLFAFVFFIEVLSSLIFLLAATSTLATVSFFNNLDLGVSGYFAPRMPLFFSQALVFFFWISLISSLNLFVFLILFYMRLTTFDWFVFEAVLFLLDEFRFADYDVFLLGAAWFNLLFSIFLKCGLVPFYFWKPAFFRGLPLSAVAFYIVFFYFFLFLFFIYFFLFCIPELFYFFAGFSIIFLLFGVSAMLVVISESYYTKTFLALSSILNSLFVLLSLSGSVYAL